MKNKQSMKINLSESQEKIVKAPLKPILVEASAGSGKTTVLKKRIRHLIGKDTIKKVLLIVFSDYIRKKESSMISNKVEIFTINDLVYEILKDLDDKSWKKLSFSDVRKNRILIYRNIKEDLKEKFFFLLGKRNFENFFNLLEKWKIRKFYDDENYFSSSEKTKLFSKKDSKKLNYEEIFNKYEEYSKKRKFLDFTDRLIYVLDHFESNESLKKSWREKFDVVLVDDCQNLNEPEFRLINYLICPDSPNFLFIGDNKQNIFRWKGSKENVFLDINEKYSNVEKFFLSENHRSGSSIVEFANKFFKTDVKMKSMRDIVGKVIHLNNLQDFNFHLFDKKKELSKLLILCSTYEEQFLLVNFLLEKKIPVFVSDFSPFDNFCFKIIFHIALLSFNKTVVKKKQFSESWSFLINNFFHEIKNNFEKEEKEEIEEILKIEISKKKKFLNSFEELINSERWGFEKKKSLNFIFEKMKIFSDLSESPKEMILKIKEFVSESNKRKIEFNSFSVVSWLIFLLDKKDDPVKWMKLFFSQAKYEASKLIFEKNKKTESIRVMTVHSSKRSNEEGENVIIYNFDPMKDDFLSSKEQRKYLAYVAITRAKNCLYLVKNVDDSNNLKKKK